MKYTQVYQGRTTVFEQGEMMLVERCGWATAMTVCKLQAVNDMGIAVELLTPMARTANFHPIHGVEVFFLSISQLQQIVFCHPSTDDLTVTVLMPPPGAHKG